MGVSINLHVYPVKSLLAAIEQHVNDNGGIREGALPPREFFMKIAEDFGAVADGKFYVVWNEYYDDYNPASQFLNIIDEYYFPDHERLGEESERGYWDSFWTDDYTTCSGGVNAEEILESLFEEDFGYEGRFR